MSYFAIDFDDLYLPISVLGAVIIIVALYPWPGRKLDHIPTIGYQSHFLSFTNAFQWYFNARQMVEDGCRKFGNGVFKIPTFGRWTVVVTGEKYIEEYRRAPENVLSFQDAADERLQLPFTLGANMTANPYHMPIVRSQLTKNIPVIFSNLHDELVNAFDEIISVKGEWVTVTPMKTMMQVVARLTNLVFVGAPLCRNEDYLQINIDITSMAVMAAVVLGLLPNFLRPIASRCLGIERMIDRTVVHLRPLIDERRRQITTYGRDYPDKPNDMLSWLMDAASEEEGTIRNLTRRMLTLNVAAIHTSSMAFCQALFDLAVHPEYVQELRDEIQSAVDHEGWSHSAFNLMPKVDSFLKESQRLNPLGHLLMGRVTRTPFTFSDGTVIPAGTLMDIAVEAAHTSEASYDGPHAFRPFRFTEKRAQTRRKVDMASTHSDFLAFGHGLHACPGRFFAAAELKLMLAHIVMTYDVRIAGEIGVRPKNLWFLTACVPNPSAKIMFCRHGGKEEFEVKKV